MHFTERDVTADRMMAALVPIKMYFLSVFTVDYNVYFCVIMFVFL